MTILCVDEYELMLLTMQHMLEHEGWGVEVCLNHTEALKKIEGTERYDVIILNEKLNDVSGLDILKRVRQLDHRARTPVIMFATSSSSAQARLFGVNAVLQKPHGIRHLVEVVTRCLREAKINPNQGEPNSQTQPKDPPEF
ncbi:MAG: response regulator [Pyrinomonadaceae bacterium]